MQRFFLFVFIVLFAAVPFLPAHAATFTAGDLIKASGQAVYYYAADGKRYVFPTEKTYKSWYTDFSGVKIVTDAELAAIQIGGNVTYRPGVRLVKITTDPKVYAVDGLRLRWIATETLAISLFGNTWASQVDDIPDAFFTNYQTGINVTIATDYVPQQVRDTFATIQAVLAQRTSPSTPTPPTSPAEPEPETPAETYGLTLTVDKTEAQANERINILAQAPINSGIAKITIQVDGIGQLTTCQNASCSANWTVPIANVQSRYVIRITGTHQTGTPIELTSTLSIVDVPLTSLARITSKRLVLKPSQYPDIRAIVDVGLQATRTDIIMNGTPVKTCTTTPGDCPYNDYLFGAIGTSYSLYAEVRTADSLTFRSPTVVLTIAENDLPSILLTPDKTTIAPGETLGINLAAEDDDGIKKIEISSNDEILRSCNNAISCGTVSGPWNVPSGTIFTLTGRAWDLKDAVSVTSITIQVQ